MWRSQLDYIVLNDPEKKHEFGMLRSQLDYIVLNDPEKDMSVEIAWLDISFSRVSSRHLVWCIVYSIAGSIDLKDAARERRRN